MADAGRFRGSEFCCGDAWWDNDSRRTGLVSDHREADVNAAELDFRAGVDGVVRDDGGGGVVAAVSSQRSVDSACIACRYIRRSPDHR